MGNKELSLIDKDITSLLAVPLRPTVTSLILHCNHIPKIEGLTSAWLLQHLDLSSNCISKIEGLSSLTSLRTLNLSCNLLTKVEGLNGLVNLAVLNVSYNKINDLTGLLHLHSSEYKLKRLRLYGNSLGSINHLLQCLLGLQSLRELTLKQRGNDNPVCRTQAYRDIVMQSLPQISSLDGLNRQNIPSDPRGDSPCNVPGLENYLDLLSDEGQGDTVSEDVPFTPHNISEVLNHFHQHIVSEVMSDPDRQCLQQVGSTVAAPAYPVTEKRIRKLEHHVSQLMQQAPMVDKCSTHTYPVASVRKPRRDTDLTSGSEYDSGTESRICNSIPKQQNTQTKRITAKKNRGRRSESDQENQEHRSSKTIVGPMRYSGTEESAGRAAPTTKVLLGSAKASIEKKPKPNEEQETYRAIVEELDLERERRWKAEQAVTKITEDLKCLNTKVNQEKDLQSMAMHTTDRLKEMLIKERSGRSELQTQLEELQRRCQSLSQQLEKARSCEEQHKTALHKLEESNSHRETLRAHQEADEMKQRQQLENKVAALKREIEIQRASVCQHRDKLQQLHELLASREQEHRKQLELRLQPGGADFHEAVAKEVASVEQKFAHQESELKERLAEGRKAYAALEDEFRMALTIEAARFSELKEMCDELTTELSETKATLVQSQQKEKKLRSLGKELTAIVKEQKTRISELIKTKREAIAELKKRLHSLESEMECNRHVSLQADMLKKEKGQLLSQLTAQESVIDGLRAERKIWGQELAQQGASLAQDRGRLEARIEVLITELESQKKQIQKDNDALKIKAKIIDDQTETIRKLKESLQERDEQSLRLRNEVVQAQMKFQQEIQEEITKCGELSKRVEHLSLRKEELSQLLEDKESELEGVKRVHSETSKNWQQKANLLTQLESQVKRMKENFDMKERLLLEDRDKATEAHKVALEKLHSVDDAFRQQLESLQATHQMELLQMDNERQKHIEQANQKVLEVEEEMRQLLFDTESNKRVMEEKIRRLNSAIKDFIPSIDIQQIH